MTTPALATTDSTFTSVRLYTAYDPYFYTTDNRPLTDIITNATGLAGSADSARRAVLLQTLQTSARLASKMPASKVIEGLRVTNTSTAVTVGPGSLFDSINMTASIATAIIKAAMNPTPKTFAVNTVTLTGAQSCIYAIEAKYVDFGSSTSVGFPFWDSANTYLPANCLFGELQLQVVAGVAANTGSQAAPSVTAGWFQLFLVEVTGPTASQTVNKIYYPSGAAFESWGMAERELLVNNLPSGGSTSATLGDFPVTAFADGSTQGAIARLHFANPGNSSEPVLNPYKPVKILLNYSPSVSSNNFRVQIGYAYMYASSALTSVSYTSLTAETIAAGTANQLQTLTLTNTIPGWSQVALSSGRPERLHITFSRIGADGADTNTGVLNLVSLAAYQ